MTIDSLIKTNEQQARQIEEMSVRIKELTAQLAWFQRRMFGRSSEKRMMLDGQLTLFDSTEDFPCSISMEEDGTGECQVNLDEDDLARMLSGSSDSCPYFQMDDEYKIVRKQM